MHNDITKRSSIRINNYIKDSSTVREVLAIAAKSNRVLEGANIVPPTDKQRADALVEIIDTLGNPTIVQLSEETTDVTVVGTPRAKTGHTFKKFKPNKYQRSGRIKPMFSEVTPGDEGIYIEVTILRDTIINGEKKNWNHSTFKDYVEVMIDTINFATGTKYELEDVYGLTKKVVKSIAADPDWVNIEEAYKAAVHDLHETLELNKRISATDDSIGICRMLSDSDFKKLVNALDATSHFRTTVEPAMEASEKAKAARQAGIAGTMLHKVEVLNELMKIKFKKMAATPFFKNKDFADYPMLALSGMNLNAKNGHAVILEYIEEREA